MSNDDSLEREAFARLDADQKIYIVKALDFGLPRNQGINRWSGRGFADAVHVARQSVYWPLPEIREQLLDCRAVTHEYPQWDAIRQCVRLDCGFSEMRTLSAFRFLYERLLGPPIRPWLTSLYLAEMCSPSVEACWREKCVSSLTLFDLGDLEDRTPILFFPDIRDVQ